jgi:hypothetical protein
MKVESADALLSLVQSRDSVTEANTNVNNFHAFTKSICQQCYDYLSGFALDWPKIKNQAIQELQAEAAASNGGQAVPANPETANLSLVPISAVEKFFDSTERKLNHDPFFWKK